MQLLCQIKNSLATVFIDHRITVLQRERRRQVRGWEQDERSALQGRVEGDFCAIEGLG
jgi:hypothetical protein